MKRALVPNNLSGKNIYLRETHLNDCNENYLSWLNDPESSRFLETRFANQSLNSIYDFVNKTNSSVDSYLCAIIDVHSDMHIGNIKVGPIHPFYKRAEISYFIGEKSYWGRGYATEAVSLMTKFAFRDLKLHKLRGLVREFNVGSKKVLEKNGYILEGVLRKEERFDKNSVWEDIYSYALLSSEYNNLN